MTRKTILTIVTALIVFSGFAIPVMATDETDLVGVISTQNEYAPLSNIRPSHLVGAAITLLLGGSGIVSFGYLLWGGVQWIMSGGDKDGVEKARKKIVSALLGLSIVFSSYALIFVIQVMFDIQIIRLDFQYIENTTYPTLPPPPPPTNTPVPVPPTSTPIPTPTSIPAASCNPALPSNVCATGPCGPGGSTITNGCTCYTPLTGCNPYDYAAWCQDPACP